MADDSHDFGEMSVMVDVVLRRMGVAFLLLAVVPCLCTGPAFAVGIFRVNAASTAETPDGATWDSAYKTLQDGADAASAAAGGEVWVAGGIYIGTSYQVVSVNQHVSLYGGFAGNETVREQRDWVANPVLIDGENKRQCINGYGSNTFDGLIISRGTGGLFGSYSATVANCVFTQNSGSSYGAMSVGGASSITNCVFTANKCTGTTQTSGGGAIKCYSGTTITNCTFSRNTASYGGAIYYNSGYTDPLRVVNCILWGDSAGTGPEIYNSTSSYPAIVSYSCIQGDYSGTFNIAIDPSFLGGPNGGSVQLKADSSWCITTGTYEGAPVADLLNRPRPQGSYVSRGAYQGAVSSAQAMPLSISVNPANAGRTYPSPGLYYFAPGDPVVLTVQPFGFRFVEWTGSVNSTDSVALIVMKASASITAQFVQDITYVNAAQAGPADGKGWETAFKTIQEGVNAVPACGGAVWVARGIYTEHTPMVMRPGVSIYGSFAGNEITASQRDLAGGVSIIDGTGLNRCVYGADDAVLDGFTVTHGRASQGAGMYNYKTSPTVVNCSFIANKSTVGEGGGVYNYSCAPTFNNCVFARNECVTGGGGMYNDSSSPRLVTCTFNSNHAAYGGGIYAYSGAPQVLNCILWGDVAAGGGGEIYNDQAGTTVLYSCIQGGYAGTGNTGADPLLVDASGGSLQLRAGSPCIDQCSVTISPATDLLGRPRPQGIWVDMGAYEGVVNADDIVTLTIQSTPENNGITEPAPGAHQYVRGEMVPLEARGVGHRFVGWGGDVTESQPRTVVLMEATKTVTAVFADNIVHVNAASQSGTPDGATWDSAFHTLQEGAAAAYAVGGGEVWVAGGNYTAEANPVLTMNPGVFIYGGFAGTEMALETRNWKVYSTVIDGQDVHRCVEGADYALLDGFTVTRGNSLYDPHDPVSGVGGGMCNASVSPTVSNCAFVGNHADSGGGAMTNIGSAAHVANCFFARNQAKGYGYFADFRGGGAMSNITSRPTVTCCTFTANMSGDAGGAVCNSYSTVDMENCVFTLNQADGNGGAMVGLFGNWGTVTNCTFSGNSAQGTGGAIYDAYSQMRVSNCILWGDTGFRGSPEFYSNYAGYYTDLIAYSCVQGGFTGTGNISADPLFVGDSGGSVKLRPNSPCVDAGTVVGAPATDILGQIRPTDTGVDMGAYEGTASPTDIVALTVRTTPEGFGRMTPTAGRHYFTRDETAILSATAVGCRFGRWSGDVDSATPDISLLMDKNKTVTAEFVPFVAYVDLAASGTGDGKSWGSAYTSLQAAVDAVAAGGGGELWVAKGTYTADTDPVLIMQPGVFLFGGFTGAEDTRSQRDWEANRTVIDGKDGRRCVVGASNALLDGFTVTGGYAAVSQNDAYKGGGMLNVSVSPTVANCLFTHNAARYGAGMFNQDNNAVIKNCFFAENIASRSQNYTDAASATYDDYSVGGGMENAGGAPTVTGCEFSGNIAALGGGLAIDYSVATVTKCVFKNNQARDQIGFYGYAGGGAICNMSARSTIRECVFTENQDRGRNPYGGGGAILNTSDTIPSSPSPNSLVTLLNCVFTRNSVAYYGGAVSSISYPTQVINCTFLNNHASYGEGNAVYSDYSSTYSSMTRSTVENCILWDSVNSDLQQIADSLSATAYAMLVTYSCVQGGYTGTGNIDTDPLFADLETGDLRLSAGSPCIDSGTAEGAPEVDMLGVPRPQGAGFDMGAYEYDITPPNAPVITGPISATNNPRPTFTWKSGGNGDAGLYRCGFAEGSWIVQESADTKFTPSSDLSDGQHTFYVQERDITGNWSVSGSLAVTVDTVAPNAPLVQGVTSPTKNPRPAWSWSSGGNGSFLYRYGYSEGTWIASDVTATDFAPKENLSDGSHALYVQERDAAGNWSGSGSFEVTVDTTPPNSPVVAGAASPTANVMPEWTWSSGGNGGIGQYRFGFAEGAWMVAAVTTTAFTLNAPLSDGSHTFFVQERDAAGNWSASGSFTLIVDAHPPNAPAVSGTVSPANSARPTWTWISGGNDGAGFFRFGYADGVWLMADTGTTAFTPESGLPDGSHALFVQERDAAGNWSASGSSTVVVDTVVYYRVTVQAATGGSIALLPAQPEGGYPSGTQVTATATATTGYTFTNWTGALAGSANPTVLVVDGDKTIGAVFTAVATEGEPPAEGEGEGEPPASATEAAQRLSDAFAGADTDKSGALSAAEARAAVPGMTDAQFGQLDADGDGQITQEELDAALNANTGCACTKSGAVTNGLKRRFADLFLLGLAMTTLLALRTRRP